MLTSAHEFGHSVLMNEGGISLSWGHKGTTNPITQTIKTNTPSYPKNASIDLMKYYDLEKSKIDFYRRIRETTVVEMDVKRLIWGSQIKWIK